MERQISLLRAHRFLFGTCRKGATEEGKEIEVNTNKNGIADFPVLEGNKLAVCVTAKGHRSYWRWIHRNASAEMTRVRLERWAKRPT